MHICHVILTHSFAGSERYAIELANAQSADHQVSVILHQRGCQQRPSALAHRLSPRITLHKVAGPKWLASLRARRLLRQLKPDVAHGHLSAGCKALQGVDGVLRLATLHIHYKASQHSHLDGLIAIAPWQLDDIPPVLRERSVQIDNWTCAVKAATEDRVQQRREWKIADEEFVIGTLGRVEPSKGHDELIEAFAMLDSPHARLVVVGDGSHLAKLRKRVPKSLQGRVHFAGYSADPQVCLAAFDGFVSAARSEPFGLVFLEAMVAGLPILATASQGGSYLQSFFQQPLVPIGAPTALAGAMQVMVERGQNRVEHDIHRFSYEQQTSTITGYYNKLLSAD